MFDRYYVDTNICRMELGRSNTADGIATQVAASTALERDPRFSPDGTRMAFVSERSGYPEIWLAADDGSHPVQLTSFAGTRTAGAPSWSPEGKNPTQVTRHGGWAAAEADDGRTLYYSKVSGEAPSLWRVPVNGGEESVAIEGVRSGHWGVARQGIFFIDVAGVPARAAKPLKLFDFASGKTSLAGVIEKITLIGDASFSVRRDGGAAIWKQIDRLESNIMLVDNVR